MIYIYSCSLLFKLQLYLAAVAAAANNATWLRQKKLAKMPAEKEREKESRRGRVTNKVCCIFLQSVEQLRKKYFLALRKNGDFSSRRFSCTLSQHAGCLCLWLVICMSGGGRGEWVVCWAWLCLQFTLACTWEITHATPPAQRLHLCFSPFFLPFIALEFHSSSCLCVAQPTAVAKGK